MWRILALSVSPVRKLFKFKTVDENSQEKTISAKYLGNSVLQIAIE